MSESEPGGHERTGRVQATDSAEATPHANGEQQPAVYVCDLCGNTMLDLHCKLVCERCGYKRDCSDP